VAWLQRCGDADCVLPGTYVCFLPARRYASAGTSYGPVSACLSVTSRSSVETAERIELGLDMGGSFHLSYTVLNGTSGIFTSKGYFPLELCPKLWP